MVSQRAPALLVAGWTPPPLASGLAHLKCWCHLRQQGGVKDFILIPSFIFHELGPIWLDVRAVGWNQMLKRVRGGPWHVKIWRSLTRAISTKIPTNAESQPPSTEVHTLHIFMLKAESLFKASLEYDVTSLTALAHTHTQRLQPTQCQFHARKNSTSSSLICDVSGSKGALFFSFYNDWIYSFLPLFVHLSYPR